ncbi:MAG: hypothetical protein R3A44_13835 [Caldilineaceae bacterium]
MTEPTYTDAVGLIPGRYRWEVKAISAEGVESQVSHRFFAVAPHNPTNVQATADSCQTIKVSWDDNSAFEQGYQIYRNGQKVSDLAALDGGSEVYTDTNRAASTTYEYKVIAYHEAATLGGVTTSVVTPACPPDTFTLTTDTVGNGSVTATPSGPYTSGTQVQLTAKPDAGWHFVRWESSAPLDDAQATQATITVVVTGNATYTAHFAKDTDPGPNPELVISTDTVGNGTVTADPPGPYASGTQVQLTAAPDAGWRFVHWESTVALGEQATQPVITVTVTANATYTAHFEPTDVPPASNETYLPLIKK